MEAVKASYFASVCNGKLIGKDCEITGVSRDNRDIKAGDMFVAICGERFDGHDFVRSARENGASCALVSREIQDTDIAQILVENTVSALGDAAKEYLRSLPAKRICITGSVGKTTTKEMCAAVASADFKTHKTQGNFNNNIGLPLTVFQMDGSHEVAVLEIGTNHFGEILPLARIASPDVAVITTIGESHLEAFGDKAGVLSEKKEILKGLSENGIAVLNGDDPYLWAIKDEITHKTIWFGLENEECDVFGTDINDGAFESTFRIKNSSAEFHIACGGEHNVRDALSAIAVGKALGMADERIAEGLKTFKNTGMRQDIYEFDGKTIIRDCYNANPDSMRASLKLLKNFETKGRKIAVLGDMRELGENADKLHVSVGETAGECADAIFVTGDFSECYQLGAGEDKTFVFDDKEKLAAALRSWAKSGDAILVKGSYGTKMWQVLEHLQNEGV